MSTASVSRPGHAGIMLWLVLGLPAAVILAGFATLAIALHAGGADAIPWEVRRTAQIQVEDRSADRTAQALGLRAAMEVERETGAITLHIEALESIDAVRLQLDLVHPSRANDDLRIDLVRSGSSWHGRLPAIAPTAWTLRLQPPGSAWRVQGRWDESGRITLLPMP